MTSRSRGPCHRHHRGNNPVWQKECCHRRRRGKKYDAAKKYNQKYDVRWGQQGTRETSPIPHHRCRVAMKLEKGRCLQRPQTYFAEGGEGGGGRQPKMVARQAADGGMRGKRRRETAVDGSGRRRTAADRGRRQTMAEEGSLLVTGRWCG